MSQAQDAIFSHGPQFMMDHTPSGAAVAGGDLLSFGTGINRLVAVADVPIEDGVLGAVSIQGGYRLKLKTGVTFAKGQTVEWDEGNSEAVDAGDGAGDFGAGICIEDAASGDDFVVTAINFGFAEPDAGSS